MPKPRKPLSLTDTLRKELATVPSVNAVAIALDLSQPSLARFLRGDTDSLTFETASQLLNHFGYVLAKPATASRSTTKRGPTTPTKRRAAKR